MIYMGMIPDINVVQHLLLYMWVLLLMSNLFSICYVIYICMITDINLVQHVLCHTCGYDY